MRLILLVFTFFLMSFAHGEPIFQTIRLIVGFPEKSSDLNRKQKNQLNELMVKTQKMCRLNGGMYILVSGIVEPDAGIRAMLNAEKRASIVADYLGKRSLIGRSIAQETSSAWSAPYRRLGLSNKLIAERGAVYLEVVCNSKI